MKRLWRAIRVTCGGMYNRITAPILAWRRRQALIQALDLVNASCIENAKKSSVTFSSFGGWFKALVSFNDKAWLYLASIAGGLLWAYHGFHLYAIYEENPTAGELPWPSGWIMFWALASVFGGFMTFIISTCELSDEIKRRGKEIELFRKKIREPMEIVPLLRQSVIDTLGLKALDVYDPSNVFSQNLTSIDAYLKIARKQLEFWKTRVAAKHERARVLIAKLDAARMSVAHQQAAIHALFKKAQAHISSIDPQFEEMVMEAQLTLLEAETDRVALEVPQLTKKYLLGVLAQLETMSSMVRSIATKSAIENAKTDNDMLEASDRIISSEAPLIAATLEAEETLQQLSCELSGTAA